MTSMQFRWVRARTTSIAEREVDRTAIIGEMVPIIGSGALACGTAPAPDQRLTAPAHSGTCATVM